MPKTTYFDVFEQCVKAIQAGELIESESEKDKEFHFQNWFRSRLKKLSLLFDEPSRNTYPDFRLVKFSEGYEVKGLKWPGRDSTYDSNSQVPTGAHNGRQIYYAFGRYPADLAPYPKQRNGRRQYPVVDLNQTTKHSYTTLGVLLMVAQPSWLRAQARGLCHQDFLSGTVPISCRLV